MASKKLRRSGGEGLADLDMDMSPMIDLTFLLLIFFMVSSHLIKVQIDKRVNPPVAANSAVAEVVAGRIVVNILADGTVWAQDKVELTSTESITAYVEEGRVRIEEQGEMPRLHLRADNEVDTRVVKRVVQAAAGRVKLVKLNIDENPMIPSKYGVRGIPTLMIFRDGQVASTKIGALPKNQLQAWIEETIET